MVGQEGQRKVNEQTLDDSYKIYPERRTISESFNAQLLNMNLNSWM